MFILDLTASVRCPLSPLGQSLVTACSNGFTLKLADDNVTEGFRSLLIDPHRMRTHSLFLRLFVGY